MKKFTRVTYIYHRILLGIVFIVSLIGMFLNEDHSVKSDYMFNCAQSGMFLIVSLLPVFLKKIDLDIPEFVYFLFICFCLAHFLFGEILGFFVKIKWWDAALHTFSGMLIALLSFSLINLLNKDNGNGFKLSLPFVVIFAFSVTLAIGVLWEILEFAFDSMFGLNMQRAYVSTMSGRGEPFVGTEALLDTMKDLILDSIGAATVCTVCAIFVLQKRVKIEDLTFIKKRVRPIDNMIEVVNRPESEDFKVNPLTLATVENAKHESKDSKNDPSKQSKNKQPEKKKTQSKTKSSAQKKKTVIKKKSTSK